MIKIAVCDDEPYVHLEIEKCLQQCKIDEGLSIDVFLNGADLILAVTNLKYDLIYLDIKMPGENGIEIAKTLRNQHCDTTIIFLTNYDEYLETGYEVDAFRYRFKPIDIDLFQKDFEAWRKWHTEHRMQAIMITTLDGTYQVKIDDILYLEIAKRKVHIITKERIYVPIENMLYWEHLLTSFASPYNKILVNKKYVKFFDDTKVVMWGGYQLPVSRRKYQQFCADMMK